MKKQNNKFTIIYKIFFDSDFALCYWSCCTAIQFLWLYLIVLNISNKKSFQCLEHEVFPLILNIKYFCIMFWSTLSLSFSSHSCNWLSCGFFRRRSITLKSFFIFTTNILSYCWKYSWSHFLILPKYSFQPISTVFAVLRSKILVLRSISKKVIVFISQPSFGNIFISSE